MLNNISLVFAGTLEVDKEHVAIRFLLPISTPGTCLISGGAFPTRTAGATGSVPVAHTHQNGLSCYRSGADANSEPTVMHELAHILVGSKEGHGAKWREMMRRLKQPVPLRYRPWYNRVFHRLIMGKELHTEALSLF